MKKTTKEMIDIMKRLSPQNQMYVLTLARVAEVAEEAAKGKIPQTNKRGNR